MQQNVQSERLPEGFNYSLERNSIPSKLPDSQKNYLRYQTSHNPILPNKLHIDQKDPSQKSRTEDKVKLIDEQIQKQKQLIQQLKKQNQLQKQELENTLNKSFLSLDPKQLQNQFNDQNSSQKDQLLETKTQVDYSFLEGRKNQATKELQNQEQKYRQNIRKMQLKKSQMKRKLKEDQQIPIKIMSFEDLEKKKENKQDEPQFIEKNIQSKRLTENQRSQKQVNFQSLENMTKKSSEALLNQKNISCQKEQVIQKVIQNQQQSMQIQENTQILQASSMKEKVQQVKIKQASLKNQQTFQKISQKSQQKSQIQDRNSNDRKSVQNKSRITQRSSHKKYSVKLSSVIVPQFNQSIKQIKQRKSQKRYENQGSVKKSSVSMVQKDQQRYIPKIDPSVKSKVSSVNGSVQNNVKLAKKVDQNESSVIQNQVIGAKSQRKSIKQRSISQKQDVKSGIEKPKTVRSLLPQELIETKLNPSVKSKSISVKSRSNSKKQQKTEFMYIPHAVKQPSHKSFKKTDKSIQWSEVDISMYGRTNEVVDESHLNSGTNNQQSYLIPSKEEINQFTQVEVNRINMKKNKLINENNFLEMSQKEMKSQKSINLVPLVANKQKSQKSNHHTNSHRNSKASFIASRQGSVRQKVDRYDKFQRDHSLKSQKVQNKLAMIESLNQQAQGNNKPASYRSRKSNPINSSSISKSRVFSVSKGEKSIKQQKSQQIQQNSHSKQQNLIQKNQSRVLISKEQINLLLSHIQKLEQKLSFIEERQQKLAQQKTQEILKLQQLILNEEKQEQEMKKSTITHKQEIFEHKIQNPDNKINPNIQQVQNLIPEIQSESKQLELPQNYIVVKNEELNLKNSQNKNEQNVQQDIQIQQIQNPISQIKQQSLDQVQSVQIDVVQVQKTIQIKQQKLQTGLQKSQLIQRQTIQHEINQIAQIQAKFSQEKSELLDQITRLKKVIREMQIQKIKSIEQNKTIISIENKSQRPDTQINEIGIIVNQKLKNRTIDQFKFDEKPSFYDQKQRSPYGKIVRNSPGKNGSRLTQNLQSSQKSPQKKFRISASKKSSILSDSMVKNTFQSGDLLPEIPNNRRYDEEGNDSLLRKKNQSYPINQKQGYIVLSNQNQNPDSKQKVQEVNLLIDNNKQEQKLLQSNEHTASKKSQSAKQEILERFHRTNRQFNNFVESSRLINQTNSQFSSQNNFFDKTNRSGSFVNNVGHKSFNNSEEDNPQNKILHKASSSNIDLHIASNQKENFQSSFTRIVNEIKDQQNKNEQQDDDQDEVPQIQISNLEFIQLPRTPDISYDQEQLMDLAKQTFKLFEIEVNNQDTDFNMKKYKNCVIFTKGLETILWHYNGKFYIGGWKGKQDGSGEKTGYGIEIVPDKHIYKGQFMNGKKHGTGIMKSTNGNIYDGQWIDGIKNGQGVYYDATTKVSYQGEWKDGKKNGFGVLKFQPKQFYKGTFVKSVKDGYGTEVFVNGDKYRGEYRRGKFHGKGKYKWANTSVFEGDFNQGMRHGHGTWKSAKNKPDIYVGSYENDKKSGYGRYFWSNGCIYEGNFSEDVKHGKGRLIYTDGRQIKGVWQEGSLLEAITENPKQYLQEDALKRSNKFKIK